MVAKEKRLRFIPLRVLASLFSAFVSYIIWIIMIDDVQYIGWDDPRDYLGPVRDDFAISVIICVGIFLISLLFIWSMFKLKCRLIAAGSIVALIICCVIYDNSQKNILEIYSHGEFSDEINLRAYEPFCENTRAKNLDGKSSLSLQNNLPRLDGATALYPLYAAFVRATYPAATYNVYDKNCGVLCSRTAEAFNNLLDGKADMIFLAGISEEQRKRADELGLELILTPIGKEAFVFFVNKRNSAKNLTVENIKGIYSGNIKNWREVGGSNIEILAYQRPENSGSQTMLKKIMGDTPIIEMPEKDIYDMMYEMYMAVAYKNHKNALGYSFLYYINDMIAENKIKFLSINGIAPTKANIANGTYPFANDFYAITVVRQYTTDDDKARADNTKKLLEWILSPQGQSLVEKTGYVPLS